MKKNERITNVLRIVRARKCGTIRYQGNEGTEHRNNPVSYIRKRLGEKEVKNGK
ncbi:hypothetical protein [Coprococcus comes]|uniref:Uncharacterized protein n=1 Tax=Coprococcus comes ATCC 27758 TaxID=470146 RepID=C0B5J0_9FIRM|nr:hypothetical protein [Coprococcus comes]EEG91330.1 hypothetical protein COPCOM_00411 [Coprococcus comes ATCC 27758]MCB6469735.1 hypothetical protein [Coprococcus comes]MDB1811833.1 hypothetical protein [Coprococcus comes]MDB1814788.1 hypothetical protein [Coprococcus comes]MDC0785237.1 hypothetical protein [Coprococcus comes]